jgi:hypothetical protein
MGTQTTRIKFIRLAIGAVVVVLLVLALVVSDNSERPKPEPPVIPDIALTDSVFPALPADAAAAGKEFQKLKQKLSKLRPNAPYVVVDTHANFADLRTMDSVMFRGACSTGSGGELVDSTTGRRWVFNTPHGVFSIKTKLKEPWWRKPDWAFFEEGEPVPENPADRFDSNVMGDFAMGFGDGYFLHGTIYERLLGINVTHGCVRLGSDDLKYIWDRAKIGTQVYIF